MDFLSSLKKAKSRRILILSAGSLQSGIAGLYLECKAESWSILSQAFLPYPQTTQALITQLLESPDTPLGLALITHLDAKISGLFLECAAALLKSIPKTQLQPHCIIANSLIIFSQEKPGGLSGAPHTFEIGSTLPLSRLYNVPILTNMLADRRAAHEGLEVLAKAQEGPILAINLGLISRMFAIDGTTKKVIADIDCGPGTCLINHSAIECGATEGFDRDGKIAATGTVDTRLCETLSADPIFSFTDSIPLSIWRCMSLLEHEALKDLLPADKLATLTALSSLSIYKSFKRTPLASSSPSIVWISGGGANNLTLVEFLSAYFHPAQVKNVSTLGIPSESFIPLCLGLSLNESLNKAKAALTDELPHLGFWITGH